MAFTIFTSGTVAYANEVMDNFYHISDGDRMPRGGVSLTSADSTYDIGSAAFKWNNIYCNTLDLAGIVVGDIWQLQTEVTLSSTATSVEMTVSGDDYDNMIVLCHFIHATSTAVIRMIFNGDSSSSYARIQMKSIYIDAASATALTQDLVSNANYIEIGNTNTVSDARNTYVYMMMPTKSTATAYKGYYNRISNTATGIVTTNITGSFSYYGTDTITSLKFMFTNDAGTERSIDPNSTIRIWAK